MVWSILLLIKSFKNSHQLSTHSYKAYIKIQHYLKPKKQRQIKLIKQIVITLIATEMAM